MENSLKNIAAVLGSIGRHLDINSVAQRKFIQKIIYLAQALGLPLNYSFSWYIHGPYSPRLTKDYFELRSHEQAGEPVAAYRLSDDYAVVAQRLSQLLQSRPADVPDADWAELLASLVFLKRESGYNEAQIRAAIAEKKGHVAPYYDQARAALNSAALI